MYTQIILWTNTKKDTKFGQNLNIFDELPNRAKIWKICKISILNSHTKSRHQFELNEKYTQEDS